MPFRISFCDNQRAATDRSRGAFPSAVRIDYPSPPSYASRRRSPSLLRITGFHQACSRFLVTESQGSLPRSRSPLPQHGSPVFNPSASTCTINNSLSGSQLSCLLGFTPLVLLSCYNPLLQRCLSQISDRVRFHRLQGGRKDERAVSRAVASRVKHVRIRTISPFNSPEEEAWRNIQVKIRRPEYASKLRRLRRSFP